MTKIKVTSMKGTIIWCGIINPNKIGELTHFEINPQSFLVEYKVNAKFKKLNFVEFIIQNYVNNPEFNNVTRTYEDIYTPTKWEKIEPFKIMIEIIADFKKIDDEVCPVCMKKLEIADDDRNGDHSTQDYTCLYCTLGIEKLWIDNDYYGARVIELNPYYHEITKEFYEKIVKLWK